MTQAQLDIFHESSTKFYYLEYKLNSNASAAELVKRLKECLKHQHDGIKLVVAFSHKAWNWLQPQWSPENLCAFESLQGQQGHAMLSTQRDVFFWIHSQKHDDNFDQVLHIQSQMQDIAQAELDLAGFDYHNNMDLIGFEDGSANPKEDERMIAALIPNGQIGEGGSYVLSQKWVHDLKAFQQLTDEQQGKVIGRYKHNNEEMEGDDMPENSHISRTDLSVDGEAMKIYRRSDPFGNATEHGLYFLAFACDLKRLSLQLESMLGLTEDGVYDRLLDFSKAETSSYWFAPAADDLKKALT